MKSSDRIQAQPGRLLRVMYRKLFAAYGPQSWWPASSAFEVVIGAYLTQNTSWRGVEKSILNLQADGSLSIEGIRNISDDSLRVLIRPSGYMVRKAAAIKAFVDFLDRDYDGSLETLAAESLPVARLKLLALPGVGPETADAILLYALGKPTVVVDEYLRRVVTRHSLLSERARYDDIKALVELSMKPEKPNTLAMHYNEFHALVVMVGKTHCGPQPKCDNCPLNTPLTPPTELVS